MEKRHGFIFYYSFYEAMKNLPDDVRLSLYDAITQFSFDGEISELNGIAGNFFSLIKANLEANNRKYENGKKAKQKQMISKTEANDKQNRSKLEANDKQTISKSEAKEKEKEKEKDKEKEEEKEKEKKIERTNKFVPPTLEDIKSEIQSKNYQIDAESFFAHYESNGWVQSSGVKIKNWKMTLVTWSKRQFLQPKSNQFQKKEISEKTGAQKIWEKMQLQGMQNG
jgi:hypothetical protein